MFLVMSAWGRERRIAPVCVPRSAYSGDQFNGLFPLSWGHNFGPVTLPGFIFFAAAFIACLTSAQVPNGSPHALQDIIMSSVGMLGMSSRPSHLGHLNLVNVRVGGIFYPCNPPKSQIKRMIGIGMPSSQSSNPRP